MRRFTLLSALFAASIGTALAQPVQLTWEGQVSGPALLRVRGDRVDFDNRYVNSPNFHFNAPLPAAPATVNVRVLEGNGRVEVIEQPRPNNDFTAVVSVNPRGRRGFFRLEMSWDARAAGTYGYNRPYGRYRNDDRSTVDDRYRDDRYRSRDYADRNAEGYRGRSEQYAGGGSMSWSGQVDNEAIIEIRGNRAIPRTVQGQPVRTGNVQFASMMPSAPVNVQLANVQGR